MAVSKATGSTVTKFHAEPLSAEGRNVCSNSPVHRTNMAVIPVHGKYVVTLFSF